MTLDERYSRWRDWVGGPEDTMLEIAFVAGYNEATRAKKETKVVGYLDGRGRFFYVTDPWMEQNHFGMTECFVAVE